MFDSFQATKSEIHKWKCVIIINSNMSNSGSSNKFNDPTLPGYDPSRPAGTAQSTSSQSSQPKPSSQPSSSSSINKFNDPTLPGYDPSRPAGTAQSTSSQSSQPSSSSSINKFNDPTLPGYDPSRPVGSEQYEQVAQRPQYNPPPRSSLPPHLRGYFPAPKL